MATDEYELRVDDRGRVVIPKEMRESVDEPSYFIADMEGCEITLTPARLEPQAGE